MTIQLVEPSMNGQATIGQHRGKPRFSTYEEWIAAKGLEPSPLPLQDGYISVTYSAWQQWQKDVIEQYEAEMSSRSTFGGDFALDEPPVIPAVWGEGDKVAWSEGEGLMLAGNQGVGKTTIGQQLLLHYIGGIFVDENGEEDTEFLGLPVQQMDEDGIAVYLAMDRPRQAARSLRRMLRESDRNRLNEKLRVHRGPLPVNVLDKPTVFVDWLRQEYGDSVRAVFVDSVKDLAAGIAKDEVGAAVNMAWQEVIARGIQLVLLHHDRKAEQGKKRPGTLDDIYGSTWLTAGLGSVLYLDGLPGDPIVKLHHRKQPAAEIGPFSVIHNHQAGESHVTDDAVDLSALARRPQGVTAKQGACSLYATVTPTRAQVEKVRRSLESIPNVRKSTHVPSHGGSEIVTYHASAEQSR